MKFKTHEYFVVNYKEVEKIIKDYFGLTINDHYNIVDDMFDNNWRNDTVQTTAL